MLKHFVGLIAASISFGALAQPINNQWIGRWTSSDGTIVVTQKNIVDQGKICKWVGQAPKAPHTGCVSFYSGTISKKEMLESLQFMRKALEENSQGMPPASLSEEKNSIDILEQQLNKISDDTFKEIDSSDADYEGSGDCGASYIMDKGQAYVIRRCESAGIGSALIVTPMVKGPDTGPVAKLNGHWSSAKWKYGYTLQDGLGTATATNSPRFKIGDEIIYLSATGNNTFAGVQVYQDGKFHPVTATLISEGRLQFKGEKNISWTMDRK